MKTTIILFAFFSITSIFAQKREIPSDTVVVTNHTTTINGTKISYSATCGMQPVWDVAGEPIATLFYTYYKKSGENAANRPLLISFNGGPGSASAWMHIAYTGPKVLSIDEEGYPVQPYGINDNPYSILDVADIVYIDPVNTGYSRTIPESGKEVKRDLFFGINADVKYLADWLTTFVTRNDRWTSPKFLIGESYGGTRVSGLALELQDKQWMYLNGVILVSPADYNVFNSDTPISSSLNLPYYAATAWYHKRLAPELQAKKLEDFLPEVEKFSLETLMPALARGASLSLTDKQSIAKKMSYFSGIEQEGILQYNLDVPTSFFWKELLRDTSGYTIGRLDSRYLGIDKVEAGTNPDYSPELSSWLHSFTPAINFYLRQGLNFKTDVKYNMFGSVHPWDTEHNQTRDNLRQAMAENPYLNIFFQGGYYDGATTYFNTKYTMWQIDPSAKMLDRMSFKAYESGHMMYLRKEDLKTANEDIRQFILKSLPGKKSAKY